MSYEVILVATEETRRDYRARQLYANSQKCHIYIEFHFNAAQYDKPGFEDNPASCLVADNASPLTQDIAREFALQVSTEFGYPNRGMVKLRKGDRGYYNLFYTNMKAILIEPLYVSDVEQAKVALSTEGQKKIARIVNNVVRKFFPDGAKVAFSLGHKCRETSIFDRGAPVVVALTPEGDHILHKTMAEADCAEKVMMFAKAMLEDSLEEETLPPSQSEVIHLQGEWTIAATNDGVLLRKR